MVIMRMKNVFCVLCLYFCVNWLYAQESLVGLESNAVLQQLAKQTKKHSKSDNILQLPFFECLLYK